MSFRSRQVQPDLLEPLGPAQKQLGSLDLSLSSALEARRSKPTLEPQLIKAEDDDEDKWSFVAFHYYQEEDGQLNLAPALRCPLGGLGPAGGRHNEQME
jgi:hypothetical protein